MSQKWCKVGPKLLLMTNRKSHTPFRLVPRSTTLGDLEWPIRTLLPTTKIWMNIEPYYLRLKCRPMTLVSGSIGFCVDICGGSLGRCLSRTAIFSVFAGYFLETLELRSALLYRDTQSIISFSVIPKCMTLYNVEWLCLFLRRFGWLRPCDFWRIITWKLIKIDTYCQWHKSLAGTLASGNTGFVRIFARVLWKEDVKGQWCHALTLVLNIFSWLSKAIA